MLSSRYLHLHEALGLGPMWLNRGVKVLSGAPPQAAAEAIPAPPIAAQTVTTQAHVEAATAKPISSLQARQAAIAAAGANLTQANTTNGYTETDRPSEKAVASLETPSAPAADIEALKQSLAATVKAAEVMVISICPSPEDIAIGQLFSGNVGTLLDNMLAAIQLDARHTHKTSWVKTASVFSPNPTAEEIAAGLPSMQAELALSQAKAVLLLGQVFDKPEQAEAIAALCGNVPYLTIPHPARLLRQPQLKAQAWQQLKKLRRLLG